MSWDEIKHALNSTLGTTNFSPLDALVNTVSTNVSNVNTNVTNIGTNVSNTLTRIGTSTSTGTTTLFGLLKRGSIKSVQRGVTNLDTNYYSYTNVTISSVTLNKTIVLIDVGGLAESVTTLRGYAVYPELEATKLILRHAAADVTRKVAWQVIEFY